MPPGHGSMCAELSVVLAVCQLLIILLQWSRVKSFMITALDRGSPNLSQGSGSKLTIFAAGQVLSPGTPPPSLSTLLKALDSNYCMLSFQGMHCSNLSMIRSAVGEGAVKCVQKLRVLCALVEERMEEEESEMREEEGKNLVSRAISAHSDWLSGCQTESRYRQGM